MKIIVDIDSTVAETLPAWLKKISEKTGIPVKPKDITTWNLHECEILSGVDPKVFMSILHTPGFKADLPVISGSKKAIDTLLKDGHEVYFVTARTGDVSMFETIAWVKKHFPRIDVHTNLIFMHNKHLISADVIIDDKPENLEKYHELYPKALKFAIEYPYNKHLGDDFYIYSNSKGSAWKEIVQTIRTHAGLAYLHKKPAPWETTKPVESEKTVAKKYDNGKPRVDLLPFESLFSVANVLGWAATGKYDDHNWRKGLPWSKIAASAIRHIFYWMLRIGPDKESGMSHLAHAACCILFLISYEMGEVGEDDRAESNATALNKLLSLMDKNATQDK